MYPDIDYAKHPNYRNFYDPRVATVAEKLFFPFYKKKQQQWLKAANFLKRTNTENYLGDNPVWEGAENIDIRGPFFDQLKEASRGLFKGLEAKSKVGKITTFSNSSIRLENQTDEHLTVSKCLQDTFEDKGVFARLSQVTGLEWEIEKIVVQVHDSTFAAKILKNCNSDVKPAIPYLHIDTSVFRFKALLYMSDVPSEDYGPFRYIRNSQAVFDPLDLIIRKSIDDTGIDGQNSLEPMVTFFNLPSFFRRRANFGNDLYSDADGHQEILNEEICFIGDEGSAILFNNDGFHRGGLVQGSNIRKIFQVLFRPKILKG